MSLALNTAVTRGFLSSLELVVLSSSLASSCLSVWELQDHTGTFLSSAKLVVIFSSALSCTSIWELHGDTSSTMVTTSPVTRLEPYDDDLLALSVNNLVNQIYLVVAQVGDGVGPPAVDAVNCLHFLVVSVHLQEF